MPWYASVHYKAGTPVPLDTLWALPAVPLAAAMRARIDELAQESIFAQAGADVLAIAELLGR